MSLLEYFLNIFRLVVFAKEFDQDTGHQAQCVSIQECIAAKISKYSLIDVSQN